VPSDSGSERPVARADRLSCDDALAAVLDDDVVVALAAQAHVHGCSRCGRAMARHRALRADLQQLGAAPVPGEGRVAGESLLAAILAGLDLEDRRATRRARWIGAGAVAGAVAGGVAAGVVAVTRGRRPALPV
jgi:hypothetical protein